MIFEGWGNVWRVVVHGTAAYVALVALLRVSGIRTLSKMNAFDLVVTVALGSTLASVLTSSEVTLAEGLAGLALLVGLQFAVAWVASRSRRFNAVIKSQPRVLYHRGTFSREALDDERITEDEIRAAMRQAAVGGMDEVESVVLESSGPADRAADRSFLRDRQHRRIDLVRTPRAVGRARVQLHREQRPLGARCGRPGRQDRGRLAE